MSDDTWHQIGDVTRRVLRKLAPEPYLVRLDIDLATNIEQRAARERCSVEALIAKAVRRYIREAA